MSNGAYSVLYPGGDKLITCDGGLNTKYPRALLPDNESPACQNVWFENGAVETRPGCSMVNTTSLGTFACDGLYVRHANTNAQTMIAFFGGSAYQMGTTTFTTIGSAQSIYTVGTRWGSAEYQNHMFCGNGYVVPYKYNGTDWTRHGIPAATGAVSAACGGSGYISAGVQYAITYVNSAAAEGDVGTFTATLAIAAGHVSLTGIPTAPQSHGVAARRIYRSDDGGNFKRVTELTNNTATTYTDNTAAASLGAVAPADNGEPPKYNAVIYHRDRLFVNDLANPNFVWYSELAEPYTFPSTNFFRVGDNTTDLVKGFQVQGESLLVVCSRSETLVYMPSSSDTDWQYIQVRSPYGSKSPYAFVKFEDKIMIPAVENDKFIGFAAIQGDAVAGDATFLTVSTAGSDLQTDRIQPDMFDVQEAYLSGISGINFKNRLYFAVPHGSSITYNNRVYVYDFSISNLERKQRGAWVPYTGWNVAQFAIYNGELYWASSLADGRVYKMAENVYSDASNPIDSYYWTKEFTGGKGAEQYHKDFRRLTVYFEKSGDYYMNLGYRNDGDLGDGNIIQLDLDPGGSLWGGMRWGFDAWGGGQQDGLIEQPLGSSRGKRIQFKFTNQNKVDQKFKVTGFSFIYTKRGRR